MATSGYFFMAMDNDDPTFGYRFLADEVKALGHVTSETRVHKLCRSHRIWSTTTKKGRRYSKVPGPAVSDDLVKRDFTAPAPNLVWLTDITEHPTSWIPVVIADEDSGNSPLSIIEIPHPRASAGCC